MLRDGIRWLCRCISQMLGERVSCTDSRREAALRLLVGKADMLPWC